MAFENPALPPPDLEAVQWAEVQYGQLGRTMLKPDLVVTGIGGFNALDALQHQALVTILNEAQLSPSRRDSRLELIESRLRPRLSAALRPSHFNGSIVDGRAHVLAFDAGRIRAYGSYTLDKDIKGGVLFYLTGVLQSRSATSPSFGQEVAYFFYTNRTAIKRALGPTDSLRQAAQTMFGERRRSRAVGSLTETTVGMAVHPGRNPALNEGGIPE